VLFARIHTFFFAYAYFPVWRRAAIQHQKCGDYHGAKTQTLYFNCNPYGNRVLGGFSPPVSAAQVCDWSIASAFDGGDGSADNPYNITNGAQLAFLVQSVNAQN